jgi:hypothetical protein
MNLIVPRKNLNISTPAVIVGGSYPTDVIDMINLNNLNIKTYKIRSMTDDYIFKFSEKNLSETPRKSRYLGKGALTAVYKIELESQNVANRYLIPDKYKQNLILRIYENLNEPEITTHIQSAIKPDIEIGNKDTYGDNQTQFINMWMDHKNKFPENIIDLFMYGDIRLNRDYIGYYTITRTYLNDKEIDNFTIKQKLNYLKNMFQFLEKIRDLGYTYRDMKYINIGADKINEDEYNFIILDYDSDTILTLAQVEDLKIAQSITYTVGTYPVFYIYEQRDKFNPTYMYLSGLLDIIVKIFNTNLNGQPSYNHFILNFTNFYRKTDTILRQFIRYIDSKKLEPAIIAVKSEFFRVFTRNLPDQSLFNDQLLFNARFKHANTTDDKIIILIKKIVNACINIDYDSVEKFIQLDVNILLINNILDSLEKLTPEDMLYTAHDIYKNKYLKYKQKYLELKNLYGGNSKELLDAIKLKDYDKIMENLNEVSPIVPYDGRYPLRLLFDKYADSGYDPEDDIITNEQYINIFNRIKEIYKLDNKDIKPYLKGNILENAEKIKLSHINNIFGISSKSVCENTIIDLKKIIISPDIINAIAKLSNEKKGIFQNMTYDDIYEQLESNGYTIEDDITGPLDRMHDILSDRPLDDINHPINVTKINDKYTIANGRHRISRALIENRQSICAIIFK